MKKRILAIFLIMIFAVTNMTVSLAAPLDNITNIDLGNYESSLDASFTGGAQDATMTGSNPVLDVGSGIIKTIMGIITFIPRVITLALLDLVLLVVPNLDAIIFNDTSNQWGKFLRLSYFDNGTAGLAGGMKGAVSTFYQLFRYIALIGFVVAIAVIAVKMIMASVGKQKQQYKDALKNWLVGLVLLVVGHWIMIYAIYLCDWLVKVIVSVKSNVIDVNFMWAGAGATDWKTTTLASAFAAAINASMHELLNIIVGLIAVIIFVAMNMKIFKVYLERVVIVGVLIMIFPIVTLLYAFEKAGVKKGATFENWLRIFIDHVFIQPIHAIALTFVMLVLSILDQYQIIMLPIVGAVVVLMVINFIFSVENIVKRVFAINGPAMGQPVNPAAAGLAGAAIGLKVGKKKIKDGADAVAKLGEGASKGKKAKAFLGGAAFGSYRNARDAAYTTGKKKFGAIVAGIGGMLTGGLGLSEFGGEVLAGAGIRVPQGLLDKERAGKGEVSKAQRTVKKAIKSGGFDANSKAAMATMLKTMDPEDLHTLMESGNISGEDISKFLNGEGNDHVGMALALGMTGKVDDLSKLQTNGVFDEDKIKGASMTQEERASILTRYAKNPPKKPKAVAKPEFDMVEPPEVKAPSSAMVPQRGDYMDDEDYNDALAVYNQEREEYAKYLEAKTKYDEWKTQSDEYDTYVEDLNKFNEEMKPFQAAFEGMEVVNPDAYKQWIKDAGIDGQRAADILTGDDEEKRSAVRAVAAAMTRPNIDLDSLKTAGSFDDNKIAHVFASSMSTAESNECIDVLQNAMFSNGSFGVSTDMQNAVEAMKVQYPDRYARGLEATGLTAHEFDSYVYGGADFGGNEFKVKSVIASMIDPSFRYSDSYDQNNFRRQFAVTPNTHSIANYGSAQEMITELGDLEARLGGSGVIEQVMMSSGIDFASKAELEDALRNNPEFGRTGFKQLISVIENGSTIVPNENKIH